MEGQGISNNGPFSITFSQRTIDNSKGFRRAAKTAPGGIETGEASGWFSSEDYRRKLSVHFKKYAGLNQLQVRSARFEVEEGSIAESAGSVEILMRVSSGYTLEDVGVEFWPKGLGFRPPARLTLVLIGKHLDYDALKAYHISGGVIEEVSVSFEERGGKKIAITTAVITVPGFSGYQLDPLYYGEKWLLEEMAETYSTGGW